MSRRGLWLRRSAYAFLGVALVQAAVVACSDDDPAVSPAVDGGVADASSGDAPVPRTDVNACRAYIAAQCEKQRECSGNDAGLDRCLQFFNLCPEYYFAPGSTRTIDNLFACADEVPSISCDDYRRGVLPTRCGNGTFDGGAPCLYSAQCASGECTTDPRSGTCGSCRNPARADGTCDGETVCGPTEMCDFGTQRCRPNLAPTRLGQPCDGGSGCASGVCLAAERGSVGACASLPATHSPCAFDVGARVYLCSEGSCSTPDGGVCNGPPSVGQPCTTGQPCVNGYCPSKASPTCAAYTPIGQPCTGYECDPKKAFCANITSRCKALPKAGESCDDVTDGSPTGVTPCLDGYCGENPADTSKHVCNPLSLPTVGLGAACVERVTPCQDFLACDGGTCGRIDLSACSVAHDL